MSFLKDKNPKGATDIFKVIVVLALPFAHAIGILMRTGYCSEELAKLVSINGVLTEIGGAIFLLCLGIDLPENRSYKNIIKMGIEISLINIVFNVVRFALPDGILVFAGNKSPSALILDVARGDIYAFIGLFCILYGVAKKHKWSLQACTLASLGMFALNLFLEKHLLPVGDVLGYYLGNFVSGYAGAHSTLLGWSIFPVLGMHIGKCMKLEKTKRDRTFGIILVGTAAGGASYLFLLRAMGTGVTEVMLKILSERFFGVHQAVLIALFQVFAVALLYFLYELIPSNPFEKKIILYSNMVMPYYLIHFVILCWVLYGGEYLLLATGHEPILYNIGGYVALALGTTVATAAICYAKGFTFSKWLFKAFDYKRWFKKKQA